MRLSNLPARRLYGKYGFRPVGLRPRYYSDDNEDALIMTTKPLAEPRMRERLQRLRAELETAPFALVEVVQAIRVGLGLPEKRQRDGQDAGHGQDGREHEGCGQRVAGTPISPARETSLRSSRASGQSVMTEPRRKTRPATQMRLTSGLTKTRK